MKRKLLLLSTVLNALCVTGFEAGAVPVAELRSQLKQVLEEGVDRKSAVRQLKKIEEALLEEQKEILTLLEKVDDDESVDANDDKPFSYSEDDAEIVTTRVEARRKLREKLENVKKLLKNSIEWQEEAEAAIKEKQEAV